MTTTDQRQQQSIIPDWMTDLSLQQQSVLMLASRGPDGIPKSHPCKDVQRAYRATVLKAGRYGRMLTTDDDGDTFMSLRCLRPDEPFQRGRDATLNLFWHEVDALPLHFVMHLLHGAQILGYKHPSGFLRGWWREFYERGVHELHLHPETEAEMDVRLSDWGQAEWEDA